MSDCHFSGSIDSNGNIEGKIESYDGVGSGPLGKTFSVILTVVIYVASIFGGISMLESVASEAPFCIVPAVLAFILLLIPLVVATKTGNFMISLLKAVYRFSGYLIALIILMFWILYISEAVSTAALMVIAFGLMYITGFLGYRCFKKTGWVGLVIISVVSGAAYLLTLAVTQDFKVGYLAIIPTVFTTLTLFISEISCVYDSDKKTVRKIPIVKMIFYVLVIASVIVFGVYTGNNKARLIEDGKTFIAEENYAEARKVLAGLKSEEAKNLYAEIRYKNLQTGEIVYNGYYDNADARSVEEDGIAFVCLDVTDGKALLISLDIIELKEYYKNTKFDREEYAENYSIDMKYIVTTSFEDTKADFFLLSKEQYLLYSENEKTAEYLKQTTASPIAKKQKKDVDEDQYKWTNPNIDVWLLNDFDGNNIGTVNAVSGEFAYEYNLRLYAGIRLCYTAITD